MFKYNNIKFTHVNAHTGLQDDHSLGNDNVVKEGDVQWTTAGRGIVHSEGPTKDFVQKGGVIEGIQIWLNLPSEKKMSQP